MKKAKCLPGISNLSRHGFLSDLAIVFGAILLVSPRAAAFPVTIDVRAVTASQFSVTGQPGAFDSSQVQVLDLAPGDYSFSVNTGGFFFFVVTPSGTVDYMPTFDAVVSGRGTTTLSVRGLEVTVDARELFASSITFSGMELSSRIVHTLRLLAAPKTIRGRFPQRSAIVLLKDDGTWDYPSVWDLALEGRGTSQLRIRGFPITIDLSPLTRPNFPIGLDSEPVEPAVHSQPFVARFLPGEHVTGSGGVFFFDVTVDGTVDYEAGLDGMAEGRGTSSLRLVGLPLEIDARGISSLRFSWGGFSGGTEFPTNTIQTLHLTPSNSHPQLLFVSGTAENPHHQFSVIFLEGGTVDYWHGYDSFLSGRGTNRLTISGFPITVDAREQANLEGNLDFCIGDIRFSSAATPAVLRLPPGSYQLDNCGTPPVPFRVGLDGSIDFAPAYDAYLSGRGTTTLNIRRSFQLSGNRFDIQFSFPGNGASTKNASLDISGEGPYFIQRTFSSDETPTLSLSEGFYRILVTNRISSLIFSVTANGTVDYYPSYDAFFSGRGTSTLQLIGLPIMVDPQPMGQSPVTIIDGLRAGDQTHSFLLLPAYNYSVGEAAGQPFVVTEDGKVDYVPSKDAFLAGRGTTTLTLNGLPVTFDFQGLSFSTINFRGVNFPTNSPAMLRMLPVHTASFLYANNFGRLDWSLGWDGTIDYSASVDNFATGRGTSTLRLTGAPITVDATALSSPAFRVFDSPFLLRSQPQTLHLLPGVLNLMPAANRGAQFRLLDNATIGLFPTYTSFMSGEGGNTLLDVGLPLDVDARGRAATTPSFSIAGLTFPSSDVAHLRLHPGVYTFTAGQLSFLVLLSPGGTVDYATSFDDRVRGRGTARLESIGGNRPPVADAGTDRTVECGSATGTSVLLDGSGSSDPDGDALSYEWKDAGGNVVGTEATVTVTLPLGAHTFTLTVSDGKGGTASDSVAVNVNVGVVGLLAPLAGLVPEGELIPIPGKAFKQGSTLPLKLQLYCGGTSLTDADVAAPQIVGLARSGEPVDLATVDLDSGEANDSGIAFRFSDGNWVYNLSTRGLSAGSYVLTIRPPDGRRFQAGFVIR